MSMNAGLWHRSIIDDSVDDCSRNVDVIPSPHYKIVLSRHEVPKVGSGLPNRNSANAGLWHRSIINDSVDDCSRNVDVIPSPHYKIALSRHEVPKVGSGLPNRNSANAGL